MGVWGSGLFENDYALDWLIQLERAASVEPILRTLEYGRTASRIETPEAMEVVAAAAMALAALGRPVSGLPVTALPLAHELRSSVGISTAALATLALIDLAGPDTSLYCDWTQDADRDAFVSAVDIMRSDLMECAVELGL